MNCVRTVGGQVPRDRVIRKQLKDDEYRPRPVPAAPARNVQLDEQVRVLHEAAIDERRDHLYGRK